VVGVTLTYPAEFPVARASKEHFRKWLAKLHRRHPGAWGIWKIEPQERGAPHYHVVLFLPDAWGMICAQRDPQRFYGGGVGEILRHDAAGEDISGQIAYRIAQAGMWGAWRMEFQTWLGQSWYATVGSGDYRHLVFHQFGDRVVEPIDDYRRFMGYLAKYVGKVVMAEDMPDGWEAPGRFWGIFNRKAYSDQAAAGVYILKREDYAYLRRVFRKAAPWRVSRSKRVRRERSTWITFDRSAGVSRSVVQLDTPEVGGGFEERHWKSAMLRILAGHGVDLGELSVVAVGWFRV